MGSRSGIDAKRVERPLLKFGCVAQKNGSRKGAGRRYRAAELNWMERICVATLSGKTQDQRKNHCTGVRVGVPIVAAVLAMST